jgi:hypothetical protein
MLLRQGLRRRRVPGNGLPPGNSAWMDSEMSSWIESLLDVEDMRGRCAAHAKWMADHPEAVWFAEAWADRNLADL